MFLRAHPLFSVVLAACLAVNGIPAPLGQTTPEYTSSRIIYKETPSTERHATQEVKTDHVSKRSSSANDDKSHLIYKKSKLPYHANLNFGDDDDDGPEVLSEHAARSEHNQLHARDTVMNYADIPQPVRGEYGAPLLGPLNVPLEEQNLDLLSPPGTDSGKVDNFKWPFSLSHNRLTKGGWARQQNGEFRAVSWNVW
jgi:hypothetical protein